MKVWADTYLCFFPDTEAFPARALSYIGLYNIVSSSIRGIIRYGEYIAISVNRSLEVFGPGWGEFGNWLNRMYAKIGIRVVATWVE